MIQYVNALVALYGTEEVEGQGLVEYALILVLISIAAFGLMQLLGTSIGTVFSNITTKLAV